jgi:hypothetical protein
MHIVNMLAINHFPVSQPGADLHKALPPKPQNFYQKKKIKILPPNFLIFLVLPLQNFCFHFGPSIFTSLGLPPIPTVICLFFKVKKNKAIK